MGPAGLLLALIGCGGSDAPAAGDQPVTLGWIEALARDPAEFSALMQSTGRDGWIQLHAHDDARAAATFGANPGLRTRPALEVAMLEADLARLSGSAHHRLFTAWRARGELPPGGAAIAAWSAWCSDRPSAPWLEELPLDDPGAEIAGLIESPPDSWPAPTSPATRRLVAHHAALTSDPTAPWDRPEQPVLTVEGEIARTWYDPCFHQVASGHARRVAAPDGWEASARGWTTAGLAGVLFAPWLTAQDLAADLDAAVAPALWGLRSASVAGLTEAGLPGEGDDAQAAREQARLLADALDARATALEAAATPDGAALLVDLHLVERWRQQWHLAQARAALAADRPRQALAFAELGTDFSSGPGPGNPPALYAVRATALLELGRAREALDALHALDDHRGVRQLAEVIGDLAVLQGLDRAGDSKEN